MVAVTSEAIREVDYDPAARILFIRFQDGDWYRYFDVPAGVHRALMAAPSHGRYFQAHVRERYRHARGRA